MNDMTEVDFAFLKKDTLSGRAFAGITRQQEKYIFARLQGLTAGKAREAAGMGKGGAIESTNKAVFEALQLFREEGRERVGITRDVVTQMMLEDRAMSVTATESLACAVQLGKLHGVFEADKQKGTKIDVTVNNNKLEILTDAELLKQSSLNLDSLIPEEVRTVEITPSVEELSND